MKTKIVRIHIDLIERLNKIDGDINNAIKKTLGLPIEEPKQPKITDIEALWAKINSMDDDLLKIIEAKFNELKAGGIDNNKVQLLPKAISNTGYNDLDEAEQDLYNRYINAHPRQIPIIESMAFTQQTKMGLDNFNAEKVITLAKQYLTKKPIHLPTTNEDDKGIVM